MSRTLGHRGEKEEKVDKETQVTKRVLLKNDI